ncbi:hypothetical protein TNIN_149441 [Trichonephila inaurata madagascariensis]|uniref:Uncharacterized protein n=1 Tax=Trichonephila inaurata madagascariensis TaxID=2747483 RepID=A0A8X6MLS0_9ARAC|nr:hypothetical protein TNIN_149441 [Trichonephila inaurata madagascariensis]
MAGQRVRIPATKNCAPQATAVCGCGERQPTEVQWKVSVRGSLLPDQGIPSARSLGRQSIRAYAQNDGNIDPERDKRITNPEKWGKASDSSRPVHLAGSKGRKVGEFSVLVIFSKPSTALQ